ncbi:putative subtilisin-like proteinase [Vairimorpha necatrix]|uniref:Subtilisin-like proteinase n=1 Tax=Vairimorpha necatrix TaxID=6039 RepID=A0AAX4J9L0_9MICR
MKPFFLIGFIFSLDNYIVLFKIKPNLSTHQSIQNYENTMTRTLQYFSPQSFITEKIKNGYIAKIDEKTVQKIKNDADVAIVEKDSIVKTADYKYYDFYITPEFKNEKKSNINKKTLAVQERAPWGLSRILGKQYLRSRKYIYPEDAGKDVEAFIIDTGIDVLHPDFRGRARWGANFVLNSPNYDENGHGTHVAGVVGGHRYGISKQVSLVAVKVLDLNGVGMISSILKGVDYVIEEHEKKRDLLYDIATASYLGMKKTPNLEKSLESFINNSELQPKTVVNMSVGGVKSSALNFAVDYATSLGIHFAVAAGNDQENACSYSPGSSKHAFTVGASDKYDRTADFSNFGQCVDVYAPGVDILSAWKNGRSTLASGTSMACPHVTGVMVLYLGQKRYSPEELKKKILQDTKHVVVNQMKEKSYIEALWPLNWFNKQEKLPLVSTNKFIKNIIEENNK